jgi:NPCBM-associated, NEW3 domain of alpha-galactosidase
LERFHTRRRSFVAIGLASLFVLSSGVRAFGQPSTTFEQAYQTGTPITVRGALSVSVADDFAKRRSETVYAIRDIKTGRLFTLRLERAPSRRLRRGAFVTVSGRAHGAELYVPSTQTQLYAQTDSTSAPSASLATASASAQLSWTVAPAANTAAGTYGVSLDTGDANTSLHHATAAGSYTVVPSCLAAPTLSFSPSTQTATAGTQVTYSIKLTNHDGSACAPTTFTLGRTVPAGWQSSLASSSLTLPPGATGTTTYSVTSPGSASSGTYGVWASVSAGSTSIHQASTSGSYTIPAGDTVPPTAPGALLATNKRRQVSLAWQPSTDNVGVVGYRVFRNGALLVTTTANGWTDHTASTGLAYSYSVVAFDAAGNVSSPRNTTTVTIGGGRKK